MSIEPRKERQLEVFSQEIRAAVRYERCLLVKFIAVLIVVAVIVVLRTLYLA